MTLASAAQMHHVEAPEHVTRAVGVYEWTGDLTKPSASRFVPVSLFINGHFEDAGLYLARPVPFALENGDLYTVLRAGEPEGVLDLDNAQRVVTGNALADDDPEGAWYGFGTFTAEAPPRPGTALHRSAHLPAIQTSGSNGASSSANKAEADDGKPHMSRREGAGDAGGPASNGSGSNGSGSGAGRDTQGDTSRGGEDDTDRPTLARRNPAQDAERKRTAAGGKKGTASVTAVGPQPGDDPDRPHLMRQAGVEEGPKPLTGTPADMHQAVAVSDAAVRDPHPFARPWEDAAERGGTLGALQALIKPRLDAYMTANHLVPATGSAAAPRAAVTHDSEGVAADSEAGEGAPPKLQRGRPTEYGGSATRAAGAAGASASTAAPAAVAGGTAAKAGAAEGAAPKAGTAAKPASARARTAAGRRVAAAKPHGAVPLTFQDGDLRGYTLTYGGLPTFVYTASVPAALAQPGDQPTAALHPTVFFTVVAQRLPSGDLQVALATVSDSSHLDRTPRLRLVDAVDPDASHRASLLFELRGADSRQFALYRLTSAHAENTFTSASIE